MNDLQHSSTASLHELRKLLEKDYGTGAAASIIVQGSDGKIVSFISHTSALDLVKALQELGASLGS